MSRSGYYGHKDPCESEEKEIEEKVINCFHKNKRNYGRIRLKKALANLGIRISECKIARILKAHGLRAKDGRTANPKNSAQKPDEKQYIEENLIKNKFAVKQANYLWCSDITELRCISGKLYLCGIIDVATRRIVGWSINRHQRKSLVHQAIRMAAGKNPQRPIGAVFHSDRGSQYTALSTKAMVERYGFRKSMSRPGRPNDNQPIESFWHTLEVELPDISKMRFNEASRTIVNYIEMYFNSLRIHSGIGYSVPNDYFVNLTL